MKIDPRQWSKLSRFLNDGVRERLAKKVEAYKSNEKAQQEAIELLREQQLFIESLERENLELHDLVNAIFGVLDKPSSNRWLN